MINEDGEKMGGTDTTQPMCPYMVYMQYNQAPKTPYGEMNIQDNNYVTEASNITTLLDWAWDTPDSIAIQITKVRP